MNFKFKIFNFQKRSSEGFTVLFAVIISVLVLAIGISIANITLKQILISSSGRESQTAFYVADSGTECVLFHDLVSQVLPENEDSPPLSSIECFGLSQSSITVDSSDDYNATTTITLKYSANVTEPCAIVTIAKNDRNKDGFSDQTTILSRGYNTCDESNARRLERGLRIKY